MLVSTIWLFYTHVSSQFRIRYKGYKVPLSSLSKDFQAKIMAYAATNPAPGRRQIEVSAVENPDEAAEQDDDNSVHDVDVDSVTRFVNLVVPRR